MGSEAGDLAANHGVQGDSRYVHPRDGLQAATLASDVLAAGELAEGADGLMWAYDDGVWRPAKNVVRDRCADLLGERYRDAHARNAESVVRARAPKITCEPTTQVINFRNTMFQWRTGLDSPHAPAYRSTVQLGCNWDPQAVCPEFDNFLAQVVHDDMIPVLWELIGYLMHSGNPLHTAVMLVGTGRNGKGTLLHVVERLLGKENVSSVTLQDLTDHRFAGASLFGKIANIAGDIDGTYLESTARFKAITGEDLVQAEHKYGQSFQFVPWAVPVFSANKIPPSADTTVGYLSRWLVIDFPHDFTGREDRTLKGRLTTKAELEGIAVKAMPALCALMQRGRFELPDSGVAAQERFRRRVNQVAEWLHDCCEQAPADPVIPRKELYESYKRWAHQSGHKGIGSSEFYERLASAGYRQKKVRGDRVFEGIRVTDPCKGWLP